MKRDALPRSCRIKHPRDFARVYAARCRASDNRLLVYAAANDVGATRMGVSVSKKLGGAVKRARLKRLLREAFRLTRRELAEGLDLVLIPQHLAEEPSLADYRESLAVLVGRLGRRLDVTPT